MSRRDRVLFANAIFASVLFVLVIGLVELRDTDRLRSLVLTDGDNSGSVPANSPAEIAEAPDCPRMESEFAAKLEQSRSCLVDDDCSLARLECPFECVTSVSTSLIDELKREEMAFLRACRWCDSSCPETLIKWRAACVRKRCIVLDRTIEELQEETLRLINGPE